MDGPEKSSDIVGGVAQGPSNKAGINEVTSEQHYNIVIILGYNN